MRFFFRSRQFKIIASVFAVVVILSVVFGLIGKHIAPHTDIVGTLTAPFKSIGSAISGIFDDISTAFSDGNELMLENEKLKTEINELREQIADYNEISAENDFLREYLEIKEKHPDFKFCGATLISKDRDDIYGGFVINKGSLAGIEMYDPVITPEGLAGYITEVGTTTCKVTTVLNPDITLGALDNRTNDSGIVSGNLNLAKENMCRFSNLSRSCSVAIGDYVVTSGEGIFPSGLLVGSIESIGSDEYNTSIYADIKPFTDFSKVKSVMVITSFDGKGGIKPGGNE